MIKKLLTVAITLAITAIPTIVTAATPEQTVKKLDTSSCASCHGDDGNSVMPAFPKLAGQHASYLVKQLNAFKKGTRDAAMMAPLAMTLSDEDITAFAEFYAKQTVSTNAMPVIDLDDDDDDDDDDEIDVNSEEAKAKAELKTQAQQDQLDKLLAMGKNIYRNGDLEREVSACIACHGPKGEGNQPAAYPNLKGQHADYAIKTLMDFKKGLRSKNSDNMMVMIAKKMTEEEIQAVAYYLSVMK